MSVGPIDLQSLFQLFTHTYNVDANVRGQAEANLKEISEKPGFLCSLISLLKASSTESSSESIAVRQAVAIYFKNLVIRIWSVAEESDKNFVKEHIVSALISESNIAVDNQLITAFKHMVREDFPHNWTQLLPEITNSLASGNVKAVRAGVMCSLILVNWRILEDSASDRDSLLRAIFTPLLTIANHLVKEDNEEAYFMLKTIMKAYKRSMQFQLSACLQEPASLGGWCTLFVQVLLEKQNVQSISAASNPGHMFWKMKKWSLHCMEGLFGRYGSPERAELNQGVYLSFSQFFIKFVFEKMFMSYLQLVQSYVEGRNRKDSLSTLTSKMRQMIFDFFAACVKNKQTWSPLKRHLSFIVSEFIFPELCHNDEDEELWQSDAYEYIHKKFDPFDDFCNSSSSAMNLLVDLNQERKKTCLPVTLGFINHILTEYSSPPVGGEEKARRKDGALCMLGTISGTVMHKKSPVAKEVPNVLVQHVFPDFSNSQFPFLRSRACWMVESFCEYMEYPDNVMISITQSILTCLRDPELPVKMRAASALSKLMETSELALESLRHAAAETMQILLSLTNEGDMECTATAMNILVSNFAQELTPFASQLTSELANSYLRLIEESNVKNADEQYDSVDENAEKVFAAMGIVRTIGSLVIALKTSDEMMGRLEEILMPMIHHTIKNNLIDVYEELFELISTITFSRHKISPLMWQIFPVIHASIVECALDYVPEMVPTLDNFISYGKDVLLSNAELMNMLFDIVNRIMTCDAMSEHEYIHGCKLMESMLLNLKVGQSSSGPLVMDTFLPKFLELALSKINEEVLSRTCIVHIIEVVLKALLYNQDLTLSWLHAKGLVSVFFEKWFSKSHLLSRVHDKKIASLVIMQMITTDIYRLPTEMQQSNIYPNLLKELVKIVATLPKAEADREKLEKEIEEDDYEDEAYDDDEDFADLSDDEQGPGEGKKNGVENDDDYDDLNDEDYDDEDDNDPVWVDELTEELVMETPIDDCDIYSMFIDLMSSGPQRHPEIFTTISKVFESDLTSKQDLEGCFSLARKRIEEEQEKKRQAEAKKASTNNN